MPAWSRLDPVERANAGRQARAGLVARGLLGPGAEPQPGRGLRSLLALRAAATPVVSVVRTTPAGADHWYAHLVRDVVLLEQVPHDAVHRFLLAAAATLPDLVVAAVLHPGPALLRADVELRTPTGSRRWACGPATPRPATGPVVRRRLLDDLADLVPGTGVTGRAG